MTLKNIQMQNENAVAESNLQMWGFHNHMIKKTTRLMWKLMFTCFSSAGINSLSYTQTQKTADHFRGSPLSTWQHLHGSTFSMTGKKNRKN